MATSLVSLPPLPQSPLPPSPPCSPDTSRPEPDYSALDPGIETPTRSPFTSSFGTNTSIGSRLGDVGMESQDPTPTPEVLSILDATSLDAVPTPVAIPPAPTPRPRGIPKLEDFELIRVLGKGCAGRVLLVREAATSSVLAMKAISKRSVLAHDELKHTLTELEILKRFAVEEPSNRTVAKLRHAFTDRENFYFVMDFYPGGDLATQMEIHGVLGHQRTRFYAVDIVQGLEDLHRQGIICRDLKPENILLNAQGHAVLADFGLSRDFGYRGEPKPIHVVTYPRQGELPPWAGKGAGSLRTLPSGAKRLVVDKAYSFVGTSEYLAPEVIKRAEYSYAVDWWALGCIVLEGMCGRVPFRKTDEEAPVELWNRILFDPWDNLFRESSQRGRPPSYYGVDEISWHFIDSLLVKDPTWRLTEPCVKQHAYFEHIPILAQRTKSSDWETVRRGEYLDPHNLQIHPVHEYNTHYFPKLCLEEDPTVDMSTHEAEYHGDQYLAKDTPLTNESFYALEQAKFRKELAGFAWSCWDQPADEEGGAEGEGEGGVGVEVGREGEVGAAERQVGKEEVDAEVDERGEAEERSVEKETDSILADDRDDAVNELAEVPHEAKARTSQPVDVVEIEEAVQAGPDSGSVEASSITDTPVELDEPTSSTPVAPTQVPLPSTGSSPALVASPASDPSPATPPAFATPPVARFIPTTQSASQTSPRKIPTPLSPKRPVVKRDISHDIALPTGLPGSGLSVSDLVSIPSPGLDSPSRIVRRHKALPSIDTMPISRLSVDLGGRIENIGDDWEELDSAEGIESLPNGPHMTTSGSFFNRVLKRRPSTLLTSGLRRTIKTSDSSVSSASPSKSSSPTKKSPMPLFGRGGGKKALEKLKVFPKTKKAPPSSYQPPPSLDSAAPAPDQPLVDSPAGSPARPGVPRRHTSSGWFDKRPRPNARSVSVKNPAGEKPLAVSMSRSVSAMPVRREKEDTSSGLSGGGETPGRAPRVSLTKTPPIVWEMD